MYIVTECEIKVDGIKKKVYGIQCCEEWVRDVSCNRNEVQKLADMFNKYNLSPCHLHDVIEDMI